MSETHPVSPVADERVPGETIRVLHVDDEREFLDVAETFLEREDERIDVTVETDPGAALDLLLTETFHCVVSDYDMPGTTGLELLERVREAKPDLPFILFTGKGSEEIASEAISAGVTDYLQKGGLETFEILANDIRTAASEYRASRALAWYRAAVEATEDAVYVRNTENRFVAVNESFVELTGYDHGRVLGAEPRLVKGEAGARVVERHVEALRRPDGPEDAVFEVEVRPATGDPVPCEDHMSAIRSDDGEFLGTVGALRDISRRKARERRVNRRLRQQETVARLGRLATEGRGIDALADEVVSGVADGLDADYGTVLELRPAEDDFHLRAGVGWQSGYVETATVGTDRDSQAGYTLVRREPVVVEDLATEERFDGSDLLTDHDVTSGVSVVVGSPTDPWGILGVHDTDRREFTEHDVDFVRSVAHVLGSAIERSAGERRIESLNDRLRERTEQFDAFADVLAHDLKNPLNTALGRIELARDGDESDLDAAEDAVERTADLVDDLAATMERGMVRGETTDCDLGERARTAWETVGTADGSLVVADAPTVGADPDALLRLLENLVRNAIEHGGDSVTVTVGATADGFYVADDGPGIPPGERDRVFEAGYTTKSSGTGYGLLSVRQIARAHGWEIEVADSPADERSESEARETATPGARFEIAVAEP